MQNRGMNAGQIEEMLYHHSGMLGVSGESGDMRKLLASRSPSAAAAVELFVYRVAREAGALVSSLGGLDGLVFTGGIGEHAAPVRAAICHRLAWLGLRLDEAANAAGRTIISMMDSAISVWVIPTDEETMIARHAAGLIPAAAPVQCASKAGSPPLVMMR
jgi:acetate kinase